MCISIVRGSPVGISGTAIGSKSRLTPRLREGQVAFLVNGDGSEKITILPDSWDTTVDLDTLAETVIIADDGFMQEMAGY